MRKNIDVERLRKEVIMWKQSAHKSALGCVDSETRKFFEGKEFAYGFVVVLIDSLQQEQPKVDLNEEVERFAKECGYGSAATIDFQFAYHFYELGLNAKKEEGL